MMFTHVMVGFVVLVLVGAIIAVTVHHHVQKKKAGSNDAFAIPSVAEMKDSDHTFSCTDVLLKEGETAHCEFGPCKDHSKDHPLLDGEMCAGPTVNMPIVGVQHFACIPKTTFCDLCHHGGEGKMKCQDEYLTFAEGNVTLLLKYMEDMQKHGGGSLGLPTMRNIHNAMISVTKKLRQFFYEQMATTKVEVPSKYRGSDNPTMSYINDLQMDYQVFHGGSSGLNAGLSVRLFHVYALFCPRVCDLRIGSFNIHPVEHPTGNQITVTASLRMKTAPKIDGKSYLHLTFGTHKKHAWVDLQIMLSTLVTVTFEKNSAGNMTLKSIELGDFEIDQFDHMLGGSDLAPLVSLGSKFHDLSGDINHALDSALRSVLHELHNSLHHLKDEFVRHNDKSIPWTLTEAMLSAGLIKTIMGDCHNVPWFGPQVNEKLDPCHMDKYNDRRTIDTC